MNAISFVAFCLQVLGVILTLGQRTLARVAIDGVQPKDLDPQEREMALRLLGPIDDIPPAARLVLCLVKGARIGGSYVFGGLYSLWRALTADLSTLAPGEQAVALIVAPDLRLARQAMRYALGAAESVSTIRRLIVSRSADGFVLQRPDGRKVSIECLPATRGGSALRGRSLVSAVLSETAFFRDSSAAVNDVDEFRAVAPRVLRGGMVILESTPWVESGLLYDLFAQNFGTPANAIAAHCPTLVMRDDERTRMIVENEIARDPENAAREFGAEFISGGSGLFLGPELVRPALDHDLTPMVSRPKVGHVAIGGDVGLVSDASAFVAVGGRDSCLTMLDYIERKPKKGSPLKLSDVIKAGCAFADRYNEKRIITDHHELQAGREHLEEGFFLEACEGGGEARTERFLRVREAFRQGRVRIPGAFTKLTNQLSLIVSKPKPGGGTSIILPRRAGTHMDLAAAFILAIDAANRAPGAGFEHFPRMPMSSTISGMFPSQRGF